MLRHLEQSLQVVSYYQIRIALVACNALEEHLQVARGWQLEFQGRQCWAWKSSQPSVALLILVDAVHGAGSQHQLAFYNCQTMSGPYDPARESLPGPVLVYEVQAESLSVCLKNSHTFALVRMSLLHNSVQCSMI